MELNEIYLNRQERKLLRKINFLTDQGNVRLVKAETLATQPEYNEYYFSHLKRLGLVDTHHYPESNDNAVYRPDNGFCSTGDGLHYFDWHWEHLRQFLYRSVLIPILVSFVTTILSAFVIAEIHRWG